MIARVVIALGLVGCAGARFSDRPLVTSVADNRPIDVPKERPFYVQEYMADIFVLRNTPRPFTLPTRTPAQDINALGEVPNSTWFHNRIGVETVTPEQVATGSAVSGPPVAPFVVVDGKSGGGNPGFYLEDSTGRKFLVKWDTMENPYQQTGADIVVSRIFSAAGYHIAADTLFHFTAEDLTIAEGAEYKNEFGKKRPFTQDVLDEILATAPPIDGGIRAIASEFLPGIPMGGFAPQGIRRDDPNDNVRHEDRRTLRGLRALAAWVSHTDMKEDNTLDMYVGEKGSGHIKHHLIDFGEALGAHQSEKDRKEDGYEYLIDLEDNGRAFLALGLWVRDWERQELTDWPEAIGWFTSDPFEPDEWKEAYPYAPFREATAADLYWGSKLVMAFDEAQIRAAVEGAQYPDPRATEYMVQTLLERQRAIGLEWIVEMSALDRWELDGTELCMTDLAVHHGLVDGLEVEVRRAGESTRHPVAADGTLCVDLPPGDYQVAKLRSHRLDGARPWIELHYRTTGDARVLGVRRKGD